MDTPYQRKGVGKAMVLFAEQLARERGFQLMYCHAREVAKQFYESLQWKQEGEQFIEVGIPHYRMNKDL